MLRRVIISLVLIAALLAVGAGVFVVLVETKPQVPTSDTPPPTLSVRALELKPQSVVEPIIGYGTAQADRYAWIAAQVSGEIVELNPKLHVGVLVAAGELLLRIDDREYQRQLERARSLLAGDEAQLDRLDVEEQNVERLIEIATSELGIAEREYERVMGLFEAGQAPRRELDVARQGYEQARRALRVLENQKALLPQQRAERQASRQLHKAEIGLAELSVERCRVHAPFAGRIEAVVVEIGERVNPGGRLFALLDPDLIEVPIELPVSLRDRVRAGARCELRLESSDEVTWSGRVARIAPSADPATRTFSLFVELDNTQQELPLMPGVFVRAQIDGPTWQDVLIVPRGVINHEHVYVYQDGRARRRAVGIQRRMLDQAVVRGLEAGEILITSNLDALFDGAPVRIRSNEAASTLAAPSASLDAPGGSDEVPESAEKTPAQACPPSEAVRGS